MVTAFMVIIILLWFWVILEILKAPCVDKNGNIIPNSSALDSIKNLIKTKIKW